MSGLSFFFLSLSSLQHFCVTIKNVILNISWIEGKMEACMCVNVWPYLSESKCVLACVGVCLCIYVCTCVYMCISNLPTSWLTTVTWKAKYNMNCIFFKVTFSMLCNVGIKRRYYKRSYFIFNDLFQLLLALWICFEASISHTVMCTGSPCAPVYKHVISTRFSLLLVGHKEEN